MLFNILPCKYYITLHNRYRYAFVNRVSQKHQIDYDLEPKIL